MPIYVEGGGDSNATLTACRKGFSTFINKMLPGKDRPSIVACGGRSQTFDDFRNALENSEKNESVLLLVDSEEPLSPGHGPWDHLKARIGDGWEKPRGASDDHAHLMVQCMESWFLADADAVADYYHKNFVKSKLPKPINGKDVEQVPKGRIESAMKAATKRTTAVGYHKTRDGFKLLEKIDPNKVCMASEQARRLRSVLESLLADKPR